MDWSGESSRRAQFDFKFQHWKRKVELFTLDGEALKFYSTDRYTFHCDIYKFQST